MKQLNLENRIYQSTHQDFVKFLKVKGYQKSSWKMYSNGSREFLFFLEARMIFSFKMIKPQDVVCYFEYIRERPNQRFSGILSESMIRHHMLSVKMFFDYLVDTEELNGSPCVLPSFKRVKAKEKQIITTDEIKQIYNQANSQKQIAVLALAYGCGLRRSEILKLQCEDVDLRSGFAIIKNSKNNKSREVPMSDKVIDDIRKYLFGDRLKLTRELGFNPKELIVKDDGRKYEGSAINRMVQKLAQKTQNLNLIKKKITLHSFRHSIATYLIDNGASIAFVQEFLGHSLIDTSHIYAKRRKLKQKYGRI